MSAVTVDRRLVGDARLKRLVAPAGAAAAAISSLAYVIARNPHAEQIFPPCVLLHTTGLYCPGCGGTRAAYDLAFGHVGRALHENAFVVLFVIPPAIVAFAWWVLNSMGVRVPRFRITVPMMWSYVGLMGLFWVVRNLPGFEFLQP